MRRIVLLSLLLGMLSACGVAEPPTAVPTAPSAQSPAYPAPIAPTPAPPQPPAAATAAPTVAAAATAPVEADPPPVAIAPESTIVTTTLDRYPLDEPGTYVAAWSPDGTQVLYAQSYGVIIDDIGYPREKLVIFNINTRQWSILAEDAVATDFHPQLRPVWDYEQDSILYTRANTDDHPATDSQPRIRSTVDLIAIHMQNKELTVIGENISPYDTNISYDGQIGVLEHNQITSYRLTDPEKIIPLPVALTQTIDQDVDSWYHRLWVAPDRMHYALTLSNTLSIYQATQSSPLQVYNFAPPAVVHQVVWSPDSTAVYYRLWEPRPPFDYYGSYAHRITDSEPHGLNVGLTGGVAWSPDSRWLTLGVVDPDGNEQQRIVDPFGASAQPVLTGFIGISEQAAWSPDQSQIASVCYTQLKLKGPDVGELCIIGIEEHQ